MITYFKARNFCGMNFRFEHFNFVGQSKYYISRHFNFEVQPKCYNLRHFCFVVVLKTEFFMCVNLQNSRSLGKSMEPKRKFKYVLIFLHTTNSQSIKNRKISFCFKSIVIYIISESTTGFLNTKT